MEPDILHLHVSEGQFELKQLSDIHICMDVSDSHQGITLRWFQGDISETQSKKSVESEGTDGKFSLVASIEALHAPYHKTFCQRLPENERRCRQAEKQDHHNECGLFHLLGDGQFWLLQKNLAISREKTSNELPRRKPSISKNKIAWSRTAGCGPSGQHPKLVTEGPATG